MQHESESIQFIKIDEEEDQERNTDNLLGSLINVIGVKMLEEVSRTHHIHNVGPGKEDDAHEDADDGLGDDVGNGGSEDELLN